jgi:type II secretory pathway pseudopilin PulG
MGPLARSGSIRLMRNSISTRVFVTRICSAPSRGVSRCHSGKPKGLIRNPDSRSPIGVGDKLRGRDINETTSGEFDPQRLNCGGFTFLEIILVVLILAIAIVPMVRAFAPAVLTASANDKTVVFANQARGTLNRVMALDFDTLSNNQGDPVDLAALLGSAAEADKETFNYQGKNYTPTVAITDESEGLGGLLRLTVTLENVRFATLKSQY